MNKHASLAGAVLVSVLKVFAVVVAATLGVGATYESVMQRMASHRYPAPGRLVDIGGRRIQIDCRGAGSPTVVLESGLDNYSSLSWAAVHGARALIHRAVHIQPMHVHYVQGSNDVLV